MPLTFGAAAVTLVAMGAILVGPAWTDCAGEAAFGSCLRQGLEDRGLLAPRPPQFAAVPDLPRFDPRPIGEIAVDVASAATMPAIPVALEQLRGGIGTSVTMPLDPVVTATMSGEVVGLVLATPGTETMHSAQGAELEQAAGTLAAAAVDRLPGVTGEASLSSQSGLILASGEAPAASAHAEVAIAAEPVVISAAAAEAVTEVPTAAGITGGSGAMAVAGSLAASAAPAIATLTSSGAGIVGAGSEASPAANVAVEIGPEPQDGLAALVARSEPPQRAAAVPAVVLPIEAEPEAEPQPEPEPDAVAPIEAEPMVPTFVYNPAFPNVILLPPPQSGENSAILRLPLK
jgi:hypothetical protein